MDKQLSQNKKNRYDIIKKAIKMVENKYKKMLEEHFENGYWEHHFSCSKASEENRECMLEIIKEKIVLNNKKI